MGKIYALLLTLLLVLIIVSSAADVEVSGTSKDTTADTKRVESTSKTNGANDKIEDPKPKGKDEVTVDGSKEKAGINTNEPDKDKSGKQLEAKEAGDKQKKANDLDDKGKEGSDSETKKETVPPVRKEGLQGEECDSSSNSCSIEEKALVACLRVPGNESPDLSLLIQNKGKETVSVSISAPSFIQLEKKQIQLRGKENNKVKVSIGKGGADNTIILTAGTGKCTLDFKDLITQDSSKDDDSNYQFAFTNFFKSKYSISFILLALFLITASVGVFISFWRKKLAKKGSRYEKIDDMELPVSSDAKRVVADSDDGWDNNWDDNWDDEEAPKTPSMPLTPILSSKSITPRRSNKDGWND